MQSLCRRLGSSLCRRSSTLCRRSSLATSSFAAAEPALPNTSVLSASRYGRNTLTVCLQLERCKGRPSRRRRGPWPASSSRRCRQLRPPETPGSSGQNCLSDGADPWSAITVLTSSLRPCSSCRPPGPQRPRQSSQSFLKQN